MDQRQKDLLNSIAPQLVEEIDFDKISLLLQIAKLVSKEKIEDIKSSVESEFSRNLKLIAALQESGSSDAFSEFILILEYTNSSNALKLISSKSRVTNVGEKNVLTKLLEKFGDFNLRWTQYPIGMHSGSNSSHTMEPSKLQRLAYQNDLDLSSSVSLKGDHQASLVRSSTIDGGRSTTKCDSNGFKLGRNNGIQSLPMADLSPVVPPATLAQDDHRNRDSNRPPFFINNQYSQTPTRFTDLNLHNRSVSDNEEENNITMSTNASEPLVCWHPYAHERTQPQSSSNQDAHRASSPANAAAHCCFPSYASSESDSSSDSYFIDPNILNQSSSVTMALAGDRAMKVQPATNCPNPKEDYKMTAQPRGPCLIVNNIDFEGDIFPTRKGSDEDSQRFDNIFQQLGFTVIMRRNQTADQMRDLFKKVAAKCKPGHDALFVFVLSHGSEHGVYGTDGLEVSVENEILPCFDNRNCKAMQGKPKVFVIQACRGRDNDFGSDGDVFDSIACPPMAASPTVVSASQENRVPTSWLSSSQPSDGKKRKHPRRSDMLIVYPCLAGYVSVRNELRGSWLGYALSFFILKHAHERSLQAILNLVTRDVMKRESSSGHIQAMELKLFGWTKNLYFNPGVYH